MKAAKSLLRIFIVAVTLLGKSAIVNAGTFVGPTTQTNRFIIGTNEAILIDTLLLQNGGGTSPDSLVISNIAYASPIATGGSDFDYFTPNSNITWAPVVVTGPAELIIGNPCVIHYTALTNPPMQTILWATTNATNVITISVPAGKTIQFFTAAVGTAEGVSHLTPMATFSSGTENFPIMILNCALFQGPATLSFDPAQNESLSLPCVLGSYWFVEDVFQNPNSVLVPGAPNVLIQKSTDLTTWQPAGMFPMTPGSNSFYRLQISK